MFNTDKAKSDEDGEIASISPKSTRSEYRSVSSERRLYENRRNVQYPTPREYYPPGSPRSSYRTPYYSRQINRDSSNLYRGPSDHNRLPPNERRYQTYRPPFRPDYMDDYRDGYRNDYRDDYRNEFRDEYRREYGSRPPIGDYGRDNLQKPFYHRARSRSPEYQRPGPDQRRSRSPEYIRSGSGLDSRSDRNDHQRPLSDRQRSERASYSRPGPGFDHPRPDLVDYRPEYQRSDQSTRPLYQKDFHRPLSIQREYRPIQRPYRPEFRNDYQRSDYQKQNDYHNHRPPFQKKEELLIRQDPIPVKVKDPLILDLERLRKEEYTLKLEVDKLEFDVYRSARDVSKFTLLLENAKEELTLIN